MNSKVYDQIQQILDAHNPDEQTELQLALKIIDAYEEGGEPEDCQEQYGAAMAYAGLAKYWGWDGEETNHQDAFTYLAGAYASGNTTILEELGRCYYNGCDSPDGTPDKEMAMAIWEEGMELGDTACALHYCTEKVDNDQANEADIAKLEEIANHPEKPMPDACAVLYHYYGREGDEDKAWEWREKGIEMGSELMQQLIEEEAEEEVGEDDWTRPAANFFPEDDDDDDEYDDYDDETEAPAHPGYPEVGEKYVIIAAVDDSFRIVQADASDWRSLPALIGAERCDDMRCQKFRDVAHKLMLPGTLLGQLDKDAFRKRYLKPNWHASQWYDGMADLMGAMVICMEDSQYNPFSFTSKEQAQSAIDALCK